MSTLNHFNAGIRVCVDQVDGGRIIGYMVSQRLTKPMFFSDIGDLLLQLERVLTAQNFPQAFQRARTFANVDSGGVPAATSVEEGMSAEEVERALGAVSTFVISVITRRNSTWQGTIDWLDGSARQNFSSVLDFIKCTDQHKFTKV